MDNNIGIGLLVGAIIGSSTYVWNSKKFTKLQKTVLIFCAIFAPVQWVLIPVVLFYNKIRKENSKEFKTEQKLTNTADNLYQLKQKGILTDSEYEAKVEKIEAEKAEQNLKNSSEYNQLKSLLDSEILTKEEFEIKVKLIRRVKATTNKAKVKKEDFIITKVENIRTFREGRISVLKIHHKKEEFYFYEIEKDERVFISINNDKIFFKNKNEFIEYFKKKYA